MAVVPIAQALETEVVTSGGSSGGLTFTSVQAQLFADEIAESVSDLPVPWYGRLAAIPRISVDVVPPAGPLPHTPSPL